MKKLPLVLFTALILALAGCALVETRPERARLAAETGNLLGLPVDWPQGQTQADETLKQLAQLLSRPLGRDQAVRLALANNPDLAWRLEEIGLTKADLVQAGLPKNPRFRALFRWPRREDLNVELEGSFSLSDLWQLPLRQEVASTRLEVTLAEISQAAVDTAAETKKAFDEVEYLLAAVKVAQNLRDKADAIAQETERRREFGYGSWEDVHQARIRAAEAEIGLVKRQGESHTAQIKLRRLLGLGPESGRLELAPPEAVSTPRLPGLAELEVLALSLRPEVKAARLKVQAARQAVVLAKAGVVKDLELGVNYEKESDGNDRFGPSLGFELPLFDRNQAQIGRAQHLLRWSERYLKVLEGRIRVGLAAALNEVETQAVRLKILDQTIIPLRLQTLEYARKYVPAMQLNRLHLLRAEAALAESELDRLSAVRGLKQALVDLERELGGRRFLGLGTWDVNND